MITDLEVYLGPIHIHFQTEATPLTSFVYHEHYRNFSCFQLNLIVKNEKGDLSTFVTNGEWHLLGKQICIVLCKINK